MKIYTEALRLWDIFDYKLDEGDFFGFEIPEIQRDYSWDIGIKNDANQADDAYRLIRDLLDFHDRDKKAEDNYFLGTLILFSMKSNSSKKVNRLQIMDGQQRMTSLIALFSVIRHIILKSKCKNLRIITEDGEETGDCEHFAEEIRVQFLEFNGELSLLPKQEVTKKTLNELREIKSYQEITEYLSPGRGSHSARLQLTGNSLYLTSILYYRELMNEFRLKDNLESDISVSKLLQFVETLRARVILNRTITDDIGLAYRMFVTANTRGKELNHFDIFRGLVIARSYELGSSKKDTDELSQDLMVTSVYLDQITDYACKDQKEKTKKINDIMQQAISILHGNLVRSGSVSRAYQQEIESSDLEKLSEFVKYIEQYTFYFLFPVEINKTDSNTYSSRYISYSRFNHLGLKQFYPIQVVSMMNGWSDYHQNYLLYVIESLTLRLYLTTESNLLSKQMDSDVMMFCKWINENNEENEKDLVIEKIKKHCVDKLFIKNRSDISSLFTTRFTSASASKKKLDVIFSMLYNNNNYIFEKKSHGRPYVHGLMPYYNSSRYPEWRRLAHKKERDDPGIYTNSIGNYFLCNGTQKVIKDTMDSPPHVRIGAFIEYGRNDTSETLQNIDNPSEWTCAEILDRTTDLIELLEVLYPSDLNPPQEKIDDFNLEVDDRLTKSIYD